MNRWMNSVITIYRPKLCVQGFGNVIISGSNMCMSFLVLSCLVVSSLTGDPGCVGCWQVLACFQWQMSFQTEIFLGLKNY